MVIMIQLIKDIIFAWKFKRAVKKADKLSRLFGMNCRANEGNGACSDCRVQPTMRCCEVLVIFLNGGLKVVPKQTIRELVRTRRFRKGVTVADIEKRALYIADGRRSPCS